MKKIVISGYYGFDNIGDELVLQEIIRQIRQLHAPVELTILSADPETTEKKYQVKAVNRWSLLQVLKAVAGSDILISGGGSLLQDTTSKNGILYYLGIIFSGQIFSKKVMILSQGIGPVSHKRNRNLVRRLLSKVDYLSVRDKESMTCLKEMGIKREIVLSADPVFLLEKKESGTEALWQELEIDPDKKLIIIALRQWDHDPEVVAAVETFSRTFSEEDYQVRYAAMHHPQDLDFLKEYVEPKKLINRKINEEEMVSLIAGSEIVIGMRLHALIIAASQEKDFLAISYDPKVTVLDKECYGDEILITTANCNAGLLQRKYEKIKKQPVSLSESKQRASLPFAYSDTIV